MHVFIIETFSLKSHFQQQVNGFSSYEIEYVYYYNTKK